MHFTSWTLAILVSAVSAAPKGWADWESAPSSIRTATSSTIRSTATVGSWAAWDPPSSKTLSPSQQTAPKSSSVSWAHDWNDWGPATSTSSRRRSTSTSLAQTSNAWEPWVNGRPRQSPASIAGSRPSPGHGSPGNGGNTAYGGSPSPSKSTASATYNNYHDPDSTWDDWRVGDALYTIAQPTATFVPIRHWEHDGRDNKHIEPCEQKPMYFATPGQGKANSGHQFAWVKMNFTSPAVILDDTDYLTYDYKEGADKLVIKFKSQTAFETAQNTWKVGMIFASTEGQCGASGAGCWLRSQTITFDTSSQSCTVSVNLIIFEDAVQFFHVDFGNWTPGRRGGRGSGRGSHSTATSGAPGTTRTTSSRAGATGTTRTTSSRTGATGTATSSSRTGTIGTATTSFTSTITSFTSTSASGSTTTASVTRVNGTFDQEDTNNPDCTAPVDNVFGLPTACLGMFFDEDIDDTYGYEDLEDTDFADLDDRYPNLAYEGASPRTPEDEQDFQDAEAIFGDPEIFVRRSMRKRQAAAPATYRRPISIFSTPFNVPQSQNLVASPWGPQLLLKQFTTQNQNPGQGLSGNLDIYCINCGLTGSVDISGSFDVGFFSGITELGIRANANMAVNLEVGVDAKIVYSNTYRQKLFTVPITPFTILGVVNLGPYVELGADLGFQARAQGRLRAGARLVWSNAFVDIAVRPSFGATSGGFTPAFEPTFLAEGTIDLTASFGLPLEIGVGVSAFGFKIGAGLVEHPSLSANAKVAYSSAGGVITTDGCNGIATSIDLTNQLYASVTGFNRLDLLNPSTLNILKKCIDLPGQGGANRDADGLDGDTTPNSADDTNGDGVVDGDDANGDTDGDGTIEAGETDTDADGDGFPDNSLKRRSHALLSRQANSSAVVDTTSLVPNVATNVSYSEVPNGDRSYDFSSTFNDVTANYRISNLVDPFLDYQALPCADGNVYLFGINETVPDSQCADQWTMTQDEDQTVIFDGQVRLLIYYPDEMSATGVSRLRLHNYEEIPIGSNALILKTNEQLSTAGTIEDVYYAQNLAGDNFYPIVCYYANDNYTRVFVANDIVTGPVTLALPTVKYSITGGDVSYCQYLELIQTSGWYTDEQVAFLYDDDNGDIDGPSNGTSATSNPSNSTITRRDDRSSKLTHKLY